MTPQGLMRKYIVELFKYEEIIHSEPIMMCVLSLCFRVPLHRFLAAATFEQTVLRARGRFLCVHLAAEQHLSNPERGIR